MLIDDLDLDNSERLKLAAAELLRGNTVTIYIETQLHKKETVFRHWLIAIFRDDFEFDAEDAEILACGATFHLKRSE